MLRSSLSPPSIDYAVVVSSNEFMVRMLGRTGRTISVAPKSLALLGEVRHYAHQFRQATPKCVSDDCDKYGVAEVRASRKWLCEDHVPPNTEVRLQATPALDFPCIECDAPAHYVDFAPEGFRVCGKCQTGWVITTIDAQPQNIQQVREVVDSLTPYLDDMYALIGSHYMSKNLDLGVPCRRSKTSLTAIVGKDRGTQDGVHVGQKWLFQGSPVTVEHLSRVRVYFTDDGNRGRMTISREQLFKQAERVRTRFEHLIEGGLL